MIPDTETADKIAHFRDYERHANGSQRIHRHPFGLLYTDGMALLANSFGAHWLLDLVASHQPAIHRSNKSRASFQVWRLMHREGRKFEVDCWSDTPQDEDDDPMNTSRRLASQVIPYSDFPPELCLNSGNRKGFQWWVEHGTALLKGER